jgi:ADP-ribosylglycohydrolase/catechol 2,3-dioxygenase-like lactoylglutathione lyase family enzyme
MSTQPNEASAALKDKGRGSFLGAAVGDALGWPNEMPSRLVRRVTGDDPVWGRSFQTWRRKSGGKFMPHEEQILAGEYSDDTQLILCSARSILQGTEWLKHFALNELPAWSAYARGGGGATNRATEMWVNGRAPWSVQVDDEKQKLYFDAGGNGVTMRILPHALCGARDANFSHVAKATLLNGICTHGHPRALVGALAYAYAIWQALRLSGTLAYGHLIELTLANRVEWSTFPEVAGVLSQWRERAEAATGGQFSKLWSSTVEECINLLERVLMGIGAGALSLDSQVLSELGCFDRTRSGAGTVCATASLYIASKYAPDPQNGVAEVAMAKGADTDTLASMAGALLGAVSGTEWLHTYRPQLQDEKYIEDLADLVSAASWDKDSENKLPSEASKPRVALNRLYESLMRSKESNAVSLPDGRQATVQGITPVIMRTESLRGQIWKLKTSDGQSVYIKKIQRTSKKTVKQLDLVSDGRRPGRKLGGQLNSRVRAVKLIVSDLGRSRHFYSEILGSRVSREFKNLINFGGVLSLVPAEYSNEMGMPGDMVPHTKCIICLETSQIESCHERVSRIPEARVTPILEKAGRRVFRCLDCDENVIEIFETAGSDSSSKQT